MSKNVPNVLSQILRKMEPEVVNKDTNVEIVITDLSHHHEIKG